MHETHLIPHLETSTKGVNFDLEQTIIDHQIDIETWFRSQWQKHSPLVTVSVDLRHAGYKISAVDTNVFPAGFNNLNPEFMPMAVQAAQSTLSRHYQSCKNIALIAESHTRNIHYFKSLLTLESIFHKAGYHIKTGTLREIAQAETFTLDDEVLVQYPVTKKEGTLYLDGYKPCVILLNHDLSDGVPEALSNLKQPLLPPLTMSWAHRSKYQHFVNYQRKAKELCQLLHLDPWFFVPLFKECRDVDFSQKETNATLIEQVESLFDDIQQKYDHFGIKDKPFVFMKADSGTYGMAVMALTSPEDIKQLNRKQRSNMATRKGGEAVNHVLLQEGIYTQERMGKQNAVAEPVIYMIGEHVIGGFYRVHTGKTEQDNLNAPGMHFEPLAFAECCNSPDQRLNPHETINQFYVYSVIARLAHLSASLEAEENA